MKLKEWNFEKYLNRRDMSTLVAKAKKRKRDEGKETIFAHHGIEIGKEKFDNFKRRKISVSREAAKVDFRESKYTQGGENLRIGLTMR